MRRPVLTRFKGSPREVPRERGLEPSPREDTRFRRSPTRGSPRKGEALIQVGGYSASIVLLISTRAKNTS